MEERVSEATDLIDAQIVAYRDRNLERFLSFYVPGVQIKGFDGLVQMDGVEGMRGPDGQLFEDSPDLRVEIRDRMQSGEYVVDQEHIEGFNLAGMPTILDAVVVYRVSNQKIQGVILLA